MFYSFEVRDFPIVYINKNHGNIYKNYYDALLFIVNSHLLFLTDHCYKDLIKNCQLPEYFL